MKLSLSAHHCTKNKETAHHCTKNKETGNCGFGHIY